jgi:predicted esterase
MQLPKVSYDIDQSSDPHATQPVFQGGSPTDQARLGVVLIHGRGASAFSLLAFADQIGAADVAYFAPQAANFSWYPERFLVETPKNEPYLSSALRKILSVLHIMDNAGISAERTVLLGFSQGGCLALEFAARYPRRYAGVIGLSAGLIGADHEDRKIAGDLAGTPVFLGCSAQDPHIPLARVAQAAAFFKQLGGNTQARLYPGADHMINQDELEMIRTMLG